MLTDAELEQTMFLNIKSIDGLDTDDDFYEYKKAVLEDEVSNLFERKNLMDQRRLSLIIQDNFERAHDRAWRKKVNGE